MAHDGSQMVDSRFKTSANSPNPEMCVCACVCVQDGYCHIALQTIAIGWLACFNSEGIYMQMMQMPVDSEFDKR